MVFIQRRDRRRRRLVPSRRGGAARLGARATRGPAVTRSDELFDALRLELRRGSLTIGVLARLREERYGYTLRQALADDGLEMDESTLYPLLRRLETQGLLVSHWREEDKRNKRFYRLSADGRKVLARLWAEWRRIGESLEKITNADPGG